MKMTITVPHEVDAKYLHCYIQPGYWEDSTINGQEDNEEGTLFKTLLPGSIMTSEQMMEMGMPECYSRGFFHLIINLDEGTVCNWPKGNTAEFGYKSCDINIFVLTDAKGDVIFQTPKGQTEYVIGPDFMNDYGDYFVLQVDADGKIVDWDQKYMIAALQVWMGEVC